MSRNLHRYSSISRVEKNKCNTQKLNNGEISDIEKKISEFDYEGLSDCHKEYIVIVTKIWETQIKVLRRCQIIG